MSQAPVKKNASATVIELLPVNRFRHGASIQSDPSSARAFVKHGEDASTTDYNLILEPGDYYELPSPVHRGPVTAVWVSAAGFAMVTEL